VPIRAGIPAAPTEASGVSHPESPSRAKRKSQRKAAIRILNPATGHSNFVNLHTASRMVDRGEASFRQRGTAIWIHHFHNTAPGVDARTLGIAQSSELAGIPVVNGNRLLNVGRRSAGPPPHPGGPRAW
jgi:hypothetical protein